jgi:hypothetical protein
MTTSAVHGIDYAFVRGALDHAPNGPAHVPGAGMFPPAFYAVMLVTAIVVTGLVVILNGIAHHTSAPR